MDPEWIGYVAAALTSASFIPQAIKTVRTRDTGGISLAMYVVFALGVALWIAYGIWLGSTPIVIANVVTLTLALAILALKIRYG